MRVQGCATGSPTTSSPEADAADGQADAADGEAVALTAWSTVHGLAMLLIDGLLEEELKSMSRKELARRVTRVLGRGLRHSAEPDAG